MRDLDTQADTKTPLLTETIEMAEERKRSLMRNRDDAELAGHNILSVNLQRQLCDTHTALEILKSPELSDILEKSLRERIKGFIETTPTVLAFRIVFLSLLTIAIAGFWGLANKTKGKEEAFVETEKALRAKNANNLPPFLKQALQYRIEDERRKAESSTKENLLDTLTHQMRVANPALPLEIQDAFRSALNQAKREGKNEGWGEGFDTACKMDPIKHIPYVPRLPKVRINLDETIDEDDK
jgi:hypothetical protein